MFPAAGLRRISHPWSRCFWPLHRRRRALRKSPRNLAAEQGRDVFAVPGSIYSPLSAAPNRLIFDGANPALSAWDILEHYRWAERPAQNARPGRAIELDEDELPLYNALLEQDLSFDELSVLSKFPASKLNSLLTSLELRGIIVKAPGGIYRAYQ